MSYAAGLSVPGYVLIGTLIAIGALLMIASMWINRSVARSIESDQRHREKLYEYYRNTFSQLGVILIGIGVSLFIFFFQQSHLEERRRQAELQQIMSRMAVRVSRTGSLVRWVSEYDTLLDDGGPYKNPEDGGKNHAVTASGPDLVKQVKSIQEVRRDIDLSEFRVAKFSDDLETSDIVNDIDPHIWFVMIDDEHELDYAVTQLGADFMDLDLALAGEDVEVVLESSERHAAVKQAVLDVLWDIDLLRDRSRRLLGRGCWFLSHGTDFVNLKPIPTLDERYDSHQAWLDEARQHLPPFSVGVVDCYTILSPADRMPGGDTLNGSTPVSRRNIASGSPYEPIIGFSRAVRIGNTIAVGGTAPIGADGKTAGVGDVAVQTRRCLEIIVAAIEQAGGRREDVIRTRTFLTRADDWEAVGRVHGEVFADVRPASTMAVVKALLDPDWLVEIEADAVVAEG